VEAVAAGELPPDADDVPEEELPDDGGVVFDGVLPEDDGAASDVFWVDPGEADETDPPSDCAPFL